MPESQNSATVAAPVATVRRVLESFVPDGSSNGMSVTWEGNTRVIDILGEVERLTLEPDGRGGTRLSATISPDNGMMAVLSEMIGGAPGLAKQIATELAKESRGLG